MQTEQEIRWSGHLTIRDGARTARDFLEALSTGASVTVDTSALESVDVSHLQILIAAHNFARGLGKRLAVMAEPGGALDAAMRGCGIADPVDAELVVAGSAWTGLVLRDGRASA
jgi:ABC-type transporter Mla MlaB component